MTNERMVELLETELLCVKKNIHNACDRDCENCELVQDAEEIITMYSKAINLLKSKEQSNAIPIKWLEAQQNEQSRCSAMWWVIRILIEKWQSEGMDTERKKE